MQLYVGKISSITTLLRLHVVCESTRYSPWYTENYSTEKKSQETKILVFLDTWKDKVNFSEKHNVWWDFPRKEILNSKETHSSFEVVSF